MDNSATTAGLADSATRFARRFDELAGNVEQFIQGKRDAVRLALVCLFAEGHLLIEDVPGVAKTSLARAIARSITADARRIQFTPDLLPSDITGVRIYDLDRREFEFKRGPVFANIVLGDEINRASPKTQSALLEVMAERQVTVDGRPEVLPRPFLVIATQNPIDHAGTYALPEAQLDRFTMRITIGYPSVRAEMAIIRAGLRRSTPDQLAPVLTTADLLELLDTVRDIVVRTEVVEYVALLAQASRTTPKLRLGVSPRGSVALTICAQALAASQGRYYVTPDDVKSLAVPVLAHRLALTGDALRAGDTAEIVVRELLASTPVVPVAAVDLR